MEEKKEKKKKNIIPLLIAIIGIVIIGVGIYLTINTKTSNTSKKKKEQPEIKESTFIYNYGIYDFKISNPYQAFADDTYGLIIKKDNIIYTIGIDMTNSYDAYKVAYQTLHADNPEGVLVKSQDKEFIFEPLQDLEGFQAASYVCENFEGKTFLGMIVKKDYSAVTVEDLNDLTTIIQETKRNEYAEGGKDMGFSGAKVFTFNRNDFIFES